jgi:hypothetical protein
MVQKTLLSPKMLSELDLLLDVARRLEEAGLEYMLTGSMALDHDAHLEAGKSNHRRHPRQIICSQIILAKW